MATTMLINFDTYRDMGLIFETTAGSVFSLLFNAQDASPPSYGVKFYFDYMGEKDQKDFEYTSPDVGVVNIATTVFKGSTSDVIKLTLNFDPANTSHKVESYEKNGKTYMRFACNATFDFQNNVNFKKAVQVPDSGPFSVLRRMFDSAPSQTVELDHEILLNKGVLTHVELDSHVDDDTIHGAGGGGSVSADVYANLAKTEIVNERQAASFGVFDGLKMTNVVAEIFHNNYPDGVNELIASTSGLSFTTFDGYWNGLGLLEMGRVLSEPTKDANTVLIWNFNNDLTDSGDNGLDLTDPYDYIGSGNISYATGKHNQCMDFQDGAPFDPSMAAYLVCPASSTNYSEIDEIGDEMSVEFFLKRDPGVNPAPWQMMPIVGNWGPKPSGGPGFDTLPLGSKFTIAMWMKTEYPGHSDTVLWGKGDQWSNNGGWITFRISGSGGMQVWGQDAANSDFMFEDAGNPALVQDGEWHHIAFTWDNESDPGFPECAIYTDGVEVYRNSQPMFGGTGSLDSAFPHVMGAMTSGGGMNESFEGQIDDFVYVPGVCMTSFDVSQEATSTTYPGAAVIYNYENNFADSSGNDNHFILRGGWEEYFPGKFGNSWHDLWDMWGTFGGDVPQGSGISEPVGWMIGVQDPGHLSFQVGNGWSWWSWDGFAVPDDGVWHHYSFAISNGVQQPGILYAKMTRDGVSIMEANWLDDGSFSLNSSGRDLVFGAGTDGWNQGITLYNGCDIDSLKIHNVFKDTFGSASSTAVVETNAFPNPVGSVNNSVVVVDDVLNNVTRQIDASTDGIAYDLTDVTAEAALSSDIKKLKFTYTAGEEGATLRFRGFGVYRYQS